MSFLAFGVMLLCILFETSEQFAYNLAGKMPKYRYSWIGLAVLLHIILLVFWFLALKLLPLSIAMPLLATTYVTVALGSRIFFKEEIDLRRWIGIISIVGGVILISVNAQ